MTRRRVLVSGASSGIANALLRLIRKDPGLEIHAVSRGASKDDSLAGVQWHESDYSDGSLSALVAALTGQSPALDCLIICNGILHNDTVAPERALRQLDERAMSSVFAVNALLPMRVLAAMTPLLKRAESPRILACSARIGSLGDNGLGGWYSYRGSKAALNMMLKSAAIEFRRLNPKAKLIAFHPGTTDTPLSKPFQARLPAGQLFSPEFVAERMWQCIESSTADGELSYLDWDGKNIPW